MNKSLVTALCGLALPALMPQHALAQSAYPAKTVIFIVPYAPGGNGDIVSRIMAQRLAPVLGQAVVVDNRAGAGGNLGAEAAAKAAPDGYTIMLGTNTHAINMSLYNKVNYDFARDFNPISLVSSAPLVLLVNPSVPAKSVNELIAYAKANPGKLAYSSGGNGTSAHITTELFKTMTGTEILHVPYKAVAQAATDLIAGQVQVLFNATSTSMSLINSGKARGLGITTTKRSPLAPGLPTIAESGVADFEASIWQGILAPARTPAPVISRLNRDITTLLGNGEVQAQLRAQGVDPMPSTPEQFAAYIRAEIPKWEKVVRASGAKVD